MNISKYNSILMKGIAISFIVVSHVVSQYNLNNKSLPFHLANLDSLGVLGVSIFFFVSGYGLSIREKRITFSYISKKIFQIWMNVIMIRISFEFFYQIFIENNFSLRSLIIYSLSFVQPYWFICIISFLYIFFLMVSTLTNQKYRFTFILSILILILNIILYLLNFSEEWYNVTLMFSIGSYFGFKTKRVEVYPKAKEFIRLIFYLIGFLVGVYLTKVPMLSSLLNKYIAAFFFIMILVICLNFIKEYKIFNVLSFLGKNSLIIYLIHIQILRYFRFWSYWGYGRIIIFILLTYICVYTFNLINNRVRLILIERYNS